MRVKEKVNTLISFYSTSFCGNDALTISSESGDPELKNTQRNPGWIKEFCRSVYTVELL
jgi:hypothetical protein